MAKVLELQLQHHAIRVASSAYLKLFLFFSAILIPTCDSSSPAFCIMYSAYTFNRQSDNIQLCHIPFPILNQSVVPCVVINVASWSAYRFLGEGIVVWYSHLFRNFPVCCDPQSKAFSVVNETEIDAFLKFSCFFNEQQMLAIWTLVSAFSIPVCTSGSSQLTYCWNLAWRILSITLLTCEVIANVQ